MKQNLNLFLGLLLAVLGFVLAGCGGVNAGGSASPASFFIPGLIRNNTRPAAPASPVAEPLPADAVQVALAR